MGPHPAVAEIRLAVRRALADLAAPLAESGDPPLVLAACSGGADSLALASAVAFEAPRLGLRAGGITVDHGLQPGSAERAEKVAALLAGLGLAPVLAVRAEIPPRPESGPYPGPEGAARAGRYAAFGAALARTGAAAILLGHTLDDQAETVLLGLARGSGGRSLAGMAPRSGPYLRPLLGVRRDRTRAACAALGLDPWEDPHNEELAYARVRIRRVVLPLLEQQLGPGVAGALARTADQLRDDADYLDGVAAEQTNFLRKGVLGVNDDGSLDAAGLAALPAAIRTRVLRAAAIEAGAPAGSLSAGHVAEIDALVTGWRGQRWVDLPGSVRCQRRYGRLRFATSETYGGDRGRHGHG